MAVRQATASGSPSAGGGGGATGVSNATARYVQNEIAVVEARLSSEIAKLEATLSTTEAQRTMDYGDLRRELQDVRTTLPSKNEMWKIVGSVVGGAVALLGLLWAVFGAGASTTGVFADQVLETKEQQAEILKRIDALKGSKNDNPPTSAGPGAVGSVRQGPGALPSGG